MSRSDIDKKVREAVVMARGDATQAVSLLMQAVERDDRLLRAVATPFLQGILFHAVQKVLTQLKGTRAAKVKTAQAPRELPREAMDALIEELGHKIPPPPPAPRRAPRTPAEALESIGRDPNGPPPPKAGKRHQNAMQLLATSFKFKPPRG